jgi:hypothetical protein
MLKNIRLFIITWAAFAALSFSGASFAQTVPDGMFPLGGSAASVKLKTDANLKELFSRATIPATTVSDDAVHIVVASPNVPVTALKDGLEVAFLSTNTNIGAIDLKLDGLSAFPLVDEDGAALPPNTMVIYRTYKARFLASNLQWRITSGLKPISASTTFITFEDLGALANGTDDGARISSALYARYNGLAISQPQTIVKIIASANKSYRLITPIVIRQNGMQIDCNGSVLDATGSAYGVDITQDGG